MSSRGVGPSGVARSSRQLRVRELRAMDGCVVIRPTCPSRSESCPPAASIIGSRPDRRPRDGGREGMVSLLCGNVRRVPPSRGQVASALNVIDAFLSRARRTPLRRILFSMRQKGTSSYAFAFMHVRNPQCTRRTLVCISGATYTGSHSCGRLFVLFSRSVSAQGRRGHLRPPAGCGHRCIAPV